MVIPPNEPTRFFAIMYDNRLAGSIGIVSKTDIYRKNAEIGYFLGEEFWGKGIATEGNLTSKVSRSFRPRDLPLNNQPLVILRIDYSINYDRFI